MVWSVELVAVPAGALVVVLPSDGVAAASGAAGVAVVVLVGAVVEGCAAGSDVVVEGVEACGAAAD